MPEEVPQKLFIDLNGRCRLELPLIHGPGFSFYLLNLMGRTHWNEEAAIALQDKLSKSGIEFDVILTAESKAIALAQELAELQADSPDYEVLRKSLKLYMPNAVEVEMQSITTKGPQHFYLGADSVERLKGKRVCVLDDVISTGGTLDAIFKVADKVGFNIAVIAAVLTEGNPREKFCGVPIVKLGHIPLLEASSEASE